MRDDPTTANNIWHLTIAYNGANYAGWQIQSVERTVQGEIQRRLCRLFRDDELTVAGTSRTDAGVHALDQHLSFIPANNAGMVPERLREIMNRWLPADIRVRDASIEHGDFHARYSSTAKAYVYAVHNGSCCSPFAAPFMWDMGYELDIGRMRAAAAHLVGTHDFAALSAKPKREVPSTIRTIHRLEVIHEPPHFYFIVIGDSFLYKMVRTLAGYLVLEAGRNPGDRKSVV